MQKLGIKWDRSIVANFEHGRRPYVTVEELLGLAVVLDVAVVHLIVPVENEESDRYQIARGIEVSPAEARAWIRGATPIAEVDPRRFHSQVPAGEFAFMPDGSVSPALMARLLDETRRRHEAEAGKLGISYEEFMRTRFGTPPGYPEGPFHGID
jgi:hypothetical protein